ncbi:MAG: hypothetical protein AB7S75_01870 [Desulfococcaceae bacterium]
MKAGDSLYLRPGVYTGGLKIKNKNGKKSRPIVISGPEKGRPAVFTGKRGRNTVSIVNSSYIVIKNLKIDGQNIPFIDAVKAGDSSRGYAHHITLENLHITGHGADRNTCGISSKCPAWDWVIRRNTIEAAGTGIYLGNSDGSQPFANGLVEYNLIVNTIGYNMQIKHQNEGTRTVSGMPSKGKTVIRYNVFSKEKNASSGSDARPNLLVGNFPASGDGSGDQYEIYGNFFYQNPSENLFQGTGTIAFYNNICVNHLDGGGIVFQKHNGFSPRNISVFYNTLIIRGDKGIRISEPDSMYRQRVIGNAIFADTPIYGASEEKDNIFDRYSNAEKYVHSAFSAPGLLNPFPIKGKLSGTAVDSDMFRDFGYSRLDFNGSVRDPRFRGAYAGEGKNPGWHPALSVRPELRLQRQF